MNRRGSLSTTDVLYESVKAKAFLSKSHSYTKKLSPALHKPRFSLKNSQCFIDSLTYRKINDWDNKDLISGSRENNKAGWRKYSICDILLLNIISDLRKLGLNIENIKSIVNNIKTSQVTTHPAGQKKPKAVPFLQLEYFALSCMSGNKTLLLIDEINKVSFLTESDAIFSHFQFDSSGNPILVLPFFAYVEQIKGSIKINKDSTITDLFELKLSDEEAKVLAIIKDRKYESIKITRKNGQLNTIYARTIQKGTISEQDIQKSLRFRDYQNVTVSVVNGKNVTLVRDETIKI